MRSPLRSRAAAWRPEPPALVRRRRAGAERGRGATASASPRAGLDARTHSPSHVRERVGGHGAAALPRAEGA